MTHKSFTTLLKIGGVAFLLFVLLFAGGNLKLSPSFIGFAIREIATVLRDSETQWMIFLCLGIYFTAFFTLRFRIKNASPHRRKDAMTSQWLGYVMFISTALYTIYYSPSIPALNLLAGVVIGQGLAVWSGLNTKLSPFSLVVSILVILLTLASVWSVASDRFFEYRGNARWSGPWDNPNSFGLLMGTGIMLVVGQIVQSLTSKVQGRGTGVRSWKLGVKKCAVVFLCLMAAICMVRGLLHSYSRGAWLATGCGMVYLVWCGVQSPKPKVQCLSCVSRLKSNWFSLAIILASVFVLMFWHFRQTNWHPAHRVLSAVNLVDFSWRNRVAAWGGALQITAEHPWFGAGWNQSEPLFEHYYLPSKLTESAAIEMNDYLMLGATLGLPALFFFGMYIWLTLTKKSEIRNQKSEMSEAEGLQIICHAAAIVLLIGFWLDSGLFKLPTASTFWILLELGSIETPEIREIHEND